MKEKVVIFRKTQCSHSLCIRFSSPPLFRNSIARGGSLFRISCLRNNYGRKRHNAVTPFATNYNRKTLLADVIINERILFPKFGAYIVYHAFFKKSKKIIGKFSVQIWQKPFPSGKIPPEGQKERAAPFSGGAPLHDRYTVSA